jgi:nicotinamidase-related amidase
MKTPSALLVIDMQAGLVHNAYREKEILQTLTELITRARANSIPVIYIQHDDTPPDDLLVTNTPAWQIHPKIAPLPDEKVFEKKRSDSFYETPLQDELRRLGVKHLLICGMQTEFCVDATSRRAIELGYSITVVADGHTTFDGNLPAQQIIAQENQKIQALDPMRVNLKTAQEIDFGFVE